MISLKQFCPYIYSSNLIFVILMGFYHDGYPIVQKKNFYVLYFHFIDFGWYGSHLDDLDQIS